MIVRLALVPVSVAVAAGLVLGGCSHGTKAAESSARSPAGAAAGGGAGGTGPSVPTTAIPGLPQAGGSTPTTAVSGTGPTVATTTIPLSPPASDAGAGSPAATTPPGSSPGPSPTASNGPPDATAGPTNPPVTDITDGDPTRFCDAVDKAIPLYFVMSIGSLDGPTSAAAYEVAVAPALTGPLHAAAASAPSVVATPFRHWADRAALADAAFRSTGATDAQVAAFARDYQAQIDSLSNAGGGQSPPDPVAAAASAGIDRTRLTAAANAFVQSNGAFDTFAATLGQDVTLTSAAQQKLAQLYPCAADLTNFTG